jgi:hypothetical protein
MKAIVLCFTLKGQPLDRILKMVEAIRAMHSQEVILIHGFMPREEVVGRGYGTEVVDALDHHFPVQLNMYSPTVGPLRMEMANTARRLDADVFVIGEAREGVAEEFALYKTLDLNIIHLLLD